MPSSKIILLHKFSSLLLLATQYRVSTFVITVCRQENSCSLKNLPSFTQVGRDRIGIRFLNGNDALLGFSLLMFSKPGCLRSSSPVRRIGSKAIRVDIQSGVSIGWCSSIFVPVWKSLGLYTRTNKQKELSFFPACLLNSDRRKYVSDNAASPMIISDLLITGWPSTRKWMLAMSKHKRIPVLSQLKAGL